MNLPKNFEQTSDEPYVRHEYKLVYSNDQSVVFDNYEDLRRSWWETPDQFLSHVEVLDKKKKKTKTKGFS
jgi:hypothetical protein